MRAEDLPRANRLPCELRDALHVKESEFEDLEEVWKLLGI